MGLGVNVYFVFSEFGTGKDRLVKVIQKDKLVNLTEILGWLNYNYCAITGLYFVCLFVGAMILPQWKSKL